MNMKFRNLNPIKPRSELASDFSLAFNTAESFIKIMKIKEMITKLRNFDCQKSSPCLCLRKCTENSMENIHTHVKV